MVLYRFLRDIEEFKTLQAKYSEAIVLLYHARCEAGAEQWLRVLERYEAKPTMDSIIDGMDDGEDIGKSLAGKTRHVKK
jgi:hypothetical protein